ncbi:S-layer homology domain-containing protein [Candidatus Peregrinibacteria bacterium]|nr:S-layer homology domain-containing protein [Candidatus Peregrinibacteria bacterium]
MSLQSDFIDYLKKQLEKPYKLGTAGPDTYDCSGLIYDACQKIYKKEVPRVSTDQYALGKTVSLPQMEIGDIVFFDTGWTSRIPNHNGVFLGNGEFINANSYNGKVAIDTLSSAYWSPKHTGTKRFFDAQGNFLKDDTSPSNIIFTDVPETHPDYAFIMQLKNAGIISGDGNISSGATTFRPNDSVNRVESLKMILKYFKILLVPDDGTIDFPDVPLKEWFHLYVKTGVQKKIIRGYADGKFKPANFVTRAEACKIIFSAKGETPPNPSSTSFSDVDLNDWSARYVIAAEKRGMILANGNKLTPHSAITRGNVCRAVLKC